MRPTILLLSFMSVFCSVFADELDPSLIKTEGDPEYGRFYGYRTISEGPGGLAFAKLRQKAENEHVPLILICSQDKCNHCTGFADNMNAEKEALLEWMSRRNALFGFFKGNSKFTQPAASKQAHTFVIGLPRQGENLFYPLYGNYYKPENGDVRSACSTFARDTWTSGSYAAFTVSMVTNQIDLVLKSYLGADNIYRDPDPHPGDVDFASGMTATTRLEAMPSTTTVYIPFERHANLSTCATNRLQVTYPDGTMFVTNFVWEATEALKQRMDVPINVEGCVREEGEIFELKLYDGVNTLNATNFIACVADEAPSHHFPLWLGERTEETLSWGDWTFDFDVATNKVRLAAANGMAAYTLVVVGGGLWCPDCINCERQLTGNPGFVEWARANKIALVVSDQPQNRTTKSSMMTHDVGSRGNSGTYYLSRKGLSMAEGMDHFSTMTNRSYNLWKVIPTAVRVANPTFILFRPDGSIAGRLTESRIRDPGVPANSEEYDFSENMRRLAELLELVQDATEEKNNWPATTPLPAYTYGETNTCSLQVSDTADVFPFVGIRAGDTFRVRAETSRSAKSTPFVRLLTITNATTGAYSELPRLVDGDNVWRLKEAQINAGIYLEVAAFSEARYAKYYTEYNDNPTAMDVTFYTETVPPDVGVIGFATNAVEFTEGSAEYIELPLERMRGSTGKVRARVDLDPAHTTAAAGSYVWTEADTNAHIVTWNDFDYGSPKNGIKVKILNDSEWTGPRTIAFTLTLLNDDPDVAPADPGILSLAVNVTDDEIRSPGRLEISATSPAAVQGMVVDVPAGGTLTLSVHRADGTLGEISTRFTVSRNDVVANVERLVWHPDGVGDDPSGVKKVTFTLPALSAFAENPVFTISLAPEDGALAVPGRSRITVRVVEAEKSAFDEIADLIEAIQNCVFSQTLTLDDPRFGANAKVVVQSGELPKGLSAEWDADAGELTVSGVVRDAGTQKVTLWLESETTGETTLPVCLNISARPLSAFSELLTVPHDYRSLPVICPTGNFGRVVGSLDMSVPLSGRMSAKYRRHNGSTVAIPFTGWDGTNASGQISATAVSKGVSVTIATLTDNTFDITLDDPEFGEMAVTAQKSVPWSYEDSAAAWAGIYTVACPYEELVSAGKTPLCTGGASLICRLTSGAAASGRMNFAGTLPNGKSLSGSTLLYRSGDAAMLPVFYGTPLECFGGCFRIRPNGLRSTTVVNVAEEMPPFWEHIESGVEAFCTLQRYSGYGSWFDPTIDWTEKIGFLYYKKTSLPFSVSLDPEWLVAGSVSGTASNELSFVDSGLLSPAAMQLDTSCGRLVGSFTVDGAAIQYGGVLTPGWIEGCDCGGDATAGESVIRPFAFGAWWHPTQVPYESGGIQHTKTAIIGEPVKIENVD